MTKYEPTIKLSDVEEARIEYLMSLETMTVHEFSELGQLLGKKDPKFDARFKAEVVFAKDAFPKVEQ